MGINLGQILAQARAKVLQDHGITQEQAWALGRDDEIEEPETRDAMDEATKAQVRKFHADVQAMLSAHPGETARIRRPARVTARTYFVRGSSRDRRDEDMIAPHLAIQAAAHVRELAAIRPDLRIGQRWNVEDRFDGPRLGCQDDAGTARQNGGQTKPEFL